MEVDRFNRVIILQFVKSHVTGLAQNSAQEKQHKKLMSAMQGMNSLQDFTYLHY